MGNRHSSAIGLRKIATPEQIKLATMHSTNKAFERYFIPDRTEIQGLYEATRECDTGVIRKQPLTKVVSGCFLKSFLGTPGRIRTCDPLIRSQILYPAELLVH